MCKLSSPEEDRRYTFVMLALYLFVWVPVSVFLALDAATIFLEPEHNLVFLMIVLVVPIIIWYVTQYSIAETDTLFVPTLKIMHRLERSPKIPPGFVPTMYRGVLKRRFNFLYLTADVSDPAQTDIVAIMKTNIYWWGNRINHPHTIYMYVIFYRGRYYSAYFLRADDQAAC